MHIYAFGSVCRGEVDHNSDIDLLAIVKGYDSRFNTSDYSVYSYSRISEIWAEGNPFAWHLFLESKLVFSSDNLNFITKLGNPVKYEGCNNDCQKFYNIFSDAAKSLIESEYSQVFDLSSIFLGIRNFATCYSLEYMDKPNFSRNSALRLGCNSIFIDEKVYNILERSRILCTRGTGTMIKDFEIQLVKNSIKEIDAWMSSLLRKIKDGNDE